MDEQEREMRINVSRNARKVIAEGDPTGWFEPLYQNANSDPNKVPWAGLEPNKFLAEWLANRPKVSNKRALVIGCGLGDDAELVAQHGYTVTAFDVAPTAIEWAIKRHADTTVNYVVADLLNPPKEWLMAFDLVIEIYTIQPLPVAIRPSVIESVANLVAQDGELFIFSAGRPDSETDPKGPPWPMSKAEFSHFATTGLTETLFETFDEFNTPRFRVVYTRK